MIKHSEDTRLKFSFVIIFTFPHSKKNPNFLKNPLVATRKDFRSRCLFHKLWSGFDSLRHLNHEKKVNTFTANFIRIKISMGNACSHMELISNVFSSAYLWVLGRRATRRLLSYRWCIINSLAYVVFLRFEDYIIKILGSKSADVRRVEVWTTQCDNKVI